MEKSSMSAVHPQSNSSSAKRGSERFEKDSLKFSPQSKRSKSSNNSRAAAPSEPASSRMNLPVNNPRDPALVTSPVSGDEWRKSFTVEHMSITSASSIQKKVTRAVDAIMGRTEPEKVVVEFHAKGPATSKMISVVEIAKRQIVSKGGKWHQYNKVEQVLVEQKAGGKNPRDNETTKEKVEGTTEQDEQGDDGEEEEEAFETMKTPFERANEGTAKVRAVPIMTIYLTHARIEELRKAYGEQTNFTEASKA